MSNYTDEFLKGKANLASPSNSGDTWPKGNEWPTEASVEPIDAVIFVCSSCGAKMHIWRRNSTDGDGGLK